MKKMINFLKSHIKVHDITRPQVDVLNVLK